jgi:hypothetical protein
VNSMKNLGIVKEILKTRNKTNLHEKVEVYHEDCGRYILAMEFLSDFARTWKVNRKRKQLRRMGDYSWNVNLEMESPVGKELLRRKSNYSNEESKAEHSSFDHSKFKEKLNFNRKY